MEGFFSDSLLLQSSKPQWVSARCGICKLHQACNSPKMLVHGEGQKSIMFVGSTPSEDEDEEGVPCSDAAGHKLRQCLSRLGIDLHRDCWYTYSTICRSTGSKKKIKASIEYCRPNLLKAIDECRPAVIILLGHQAMLGLLGHLWSSNIGSYLEWTGWQIPSQDLNAWVCPTYHPRDIDRYKNDRLVGLWFNQHLRRAVSLTEHPWDEVPDYESQVECLFDADDAVDAIESGMKSCKAIAFDYETNCLKPDPDHARIVSCAICFDGDRTIAFPWTRHVVDVMSRLLRSNVPKIAANMKFEDRWTRRILGHGVCNWIWDTMQSAHVLDNREGITSLKFQSFVQFGFGKYNDHIDRFFKSESSNSVNLIHEIDMQSLLRYNGLDALLEYKLAEVQMEQMNCKELLHDDRQ